MGTSKKCGCSQPLDQEMLLVPTTASTANPCGNPTSPATSVADCPIQEPTFDSIKSSFIVPEYGDDITIQVCNASVYSIGEYFEFIGQNGLTMLVSSVDSGTNFITLKNACSNGNEIGDNPPAGGTVSKGAFFFVVGQPTCASESDQAEELISALDEVEEICVSNLTETPEEDFEAQVIGRVEDADSDLGIGKCMRRIFGFMFSLGAPKTPNIQLLAEVDNFASRDICASKSGGQYRTRRQPHEWTGVKDNAKYIYAGSKVGYKSIGPAYITSMFGPKALKNVGTFTDTGTYVVLTNATLSEDISVGFTELTDIINRNMQDHFYLELHVIVSLFGTSSGSQRKLEIKLNDELIGILTGGSSGVYSTDTVVYPLKILNSASDFNFKLVATGACRYAYSIKALGARV